MLRGPTQAAIGMVVPKNNKLQSRSFGLARGNPMTEILCRSWSRPMSWARKSRPFPCLLIVASVALWLAASSTAALGSCSNPANPIEAENCLPGNPSSEWDVGINGDDPNLVGFATDISVNAGQTVNFKINSSYVSYQ